MRAVAVLTQSTQDCRPDNYGYRGTRPAGPISETPNVMSISLATLTGEADELRVPPRLRWG
jgi:hypothetical protein